MEARTRLTQTGVALGTPKYMAPELLLDRPSDGRVDQYALGVIVYEALSGRSPYEAATIAQLVQCLLTKELPRLDGLVHVPKSLADAVARAIARDSQARFVSCLEFAEAAAGSSRVVVAISTDRGPQKPSFELGSKPAPTSESQPSGTDVRTPVQRVSGIGETQVAPLANRTPRMVGAP